MSRDDDGAYRVREGLSKRIRSIVIVVFVCNFDERGNVIFFFL